MRPRTVHGPVRTCQSRFTHDFFAVALSPPAADLTLTYWFVHCDEAAVWTTYNDFDVRRRGRKDTSILGGDVMTIRKPVVSQAALVLASIASTAAFAQTAPGASDEAVEVDEILVTGSRIARSDFSSTSPIVTYGEEAIAQSGTVNIEQAMNQLPQFVQGQTSSTVGRRGARGTCVTQPAWSGRDTKSRAARWAASAAVERECRRRRQPDSAVHPERRRDDHRRRVRRVRFRRDVRRRQLQEPDRLHRPASSMCARE